MFKINGGKKLEGNVVIGGSKNAALPIIAASLLIKGKVTLKNVPNISDIHTFCSLLEEIGAKTDIRNNTLTIDSSNLVESNFDLEKIRKVRASVLLLGPLLERIGKISIPIPGGCNIGARSIDSHLNGLKSIGYKVKDKKDEIYLHGKTKFGNMVINANFGVTPTENLLVANVLRKGTTIINSAAIEPHVMNLIDFLRKAGANIFIRYNHTIIIEGVSELKNDFDFEIISDYIQSGSYMVIGALASHDYITIENARIDDLYFYIEKLREAGIKIEDMGDDKVKVHRCKNIKPVNIQTNIFPGFPTDLQSPFSILMTKSDGASKIHEVLFEGRLNWLVELENMGGHIAVLNPHEAMIFGETKLKGANVTSWDLRAGCAMVIAGLIAEGQTVVTNIEYIKRGYENFLDNLRRLGADIEEI